MGEFTKLNISIENTSNKLIFHNIAVNAAASDQIKKYDVSKELGDLYPESSIETSLILNTRHDLPTVVTLNINSVNGAEVSLQKNCG